MNASARRVAVLGGIRIPFARQNGPHAGVRKRGPAGCAARAEPRQQGIGRAIAKVLARDGAHVTGVDLPGRRRELEETIGELGGSILLLDIIEEDAPARIATYLLDGGPWNTVLAINLTAQERIGDELLAREAIRENGRIVCVSSMSGIAGNAGQA